MKTIPIFIFSVTVIIGGFILFHSLTYKNPASLATNIFPTETNSKVQVIKATYGPPFGFSPLDFSVKVGIPVRLEVLATENGRGCMGSITIPGLNEEVQTFRKGQTNIFEFTPRSLLGQYAITCAMGIPHATITVE